MGFAVATCTADGRVLDASPTARTALASIGVGADQALPSALWALLCSAGVGEEVEWHRASPIASSLAFSKLPYGDSKAVVLMEEASTKRIVMARKLHEARLDARARVVTSVTRRLRRPLALLEEARAAGTEPVAVAARELQRVIDGALDLARLGPPALWTIDVADAVDRARQDALASASLHDGSLRVEVEADARWGRGNPFAIELVVRELLVNALEATPERAAIRVRASRSSRDWIDVAVEDEGPGIPASVAGQMFEPFFSTKAERTGLGLTTAREIATDQGGELRFEPSEVGARFVLTLAAAEAADDAGGRT